MTLAFKRIGLIGKYGDPSVQGVLKILSQHLKQLHAQVILDEATAELWPGHSLDVLPRADLAMQCDLAIVTGGDGTLLNAARSLAQYDVPLLGINQGRLGFLADISPDHMLEKLDDILQGNYQEEERILLHAAIERDGIIVNQSNALNDVVVHKWGVMRMIEFETCINDVFVHTHRSDGIIIATPTGSTAYALSSGGPILHPALDAMVLVPVSPHTLSNRPIVIDGDSHVTIIVENSNQPKVQVTCDGQISLDWNAGDLIKIRKDKKIRLIHPAQHDPYTILRAKLQWGGKLDAP